MKHKATITIEVDTETSEVNFRFDFKPEIETRNPDSNKAAIIAGKMLKLIQEDGLVK